MTEDMTKALQDLADLKVKAEQYEARIAELEKSNSDLTKDIESKSAEIVTLQARLYRNISTAKEPEHQEQVHDFHSDYQRMIRENMARHKE